MFLFWRSEVFRVPAGSILGRSGLSIPFSAIPGTGASSKCQLLREHFASQDVVWSKPHLLSALDKANISLGLLASASLPRPSWLRHPLLCLPSLSAISIPRGLPLVILVSACCRFLTLRTLSATHCLAPIAGDRGITNKQQHRGHISQSLSGRCLPGWNKSPINMLLFIASDRLIN